MRERAEELGGTFIIGDNTPGTVVRATLPSTGTSHDHRAHRRRPPDVRAGLVAALAPVDGIEVIAEADDGETAVTLAGQVQPDVILMDLTMPGLGGIAATRAITDEYPTIAVLVLTMGEAGDSIWAALRAGARGYLVKGSTKTEIEKTIAVAASDGMVFGPAWPNVSKPHSDPTAEHRTRSPISPTQTEILRLIAREQTTPKWPPRSPSRTRPSATTSTTSSPSFKYIAAPRPWNRRPSRPQRRPNPLTTRDTTRTTT